MMRNSMLSFCLVRGGMSRPGDYESVDEYDLYDDGRKSDIIIYDTQFFDRVFEWTCILQTT